jgi:hypothetical protein
MISHKAQAAACRVKDRNKCERDQKMQGQTENGRGGPALKSLRTEQAAGDKLQKPGDGRSPRKRDDESRKDIQRADDQTGHNNSSDGSTHSARLGLKRFA